jgi:hypothetical protein
MTVGYCEEGFCGGGIDEMTYFILFCSIFIFGAAGSLLARRHTGFVLIPGGFVVVVVVFAMTVILNFDFWTSFLWITGGVAGIQAGFVIGLAGRRLDLLSAIRRLGHAKAMPMD